MNETSEAEARESGKELTMECPAWEKTGSVHCLRELTKNVKTDLISTRTCKFLFAKGTFLPYYYSN